MNVVNFGSLNIDYTYRVPHFVRPGETMACHSMTINSGGKGLNQSVALARAGASVLHAGFVGKEGAFLADKLREKGVDTTFLCTTEDSCGHAIIQVDQGGQNCIMIYGGTNRILTTDYVEEVLSHFGPGDVVLLQNETNLVGEIIERASACGLKVAFNAAPMDAQVLNYPLDKVDWLFVNETEGEALTGRQAPEDIAFTLRERYPSTAVILTLGQKGSRYVGPEGNFAQSIFPVEAVDTTGAGDTFTGFFLHAVLEGDAPAEALRIAAAASAIAVTRPGAADSIPTWDEVAIWMAKA